VATSLGTDTQLFGTILSAAQVTLRERAHVFGSVYSSVSPLVRQNGTSIDGNTNLSVGFAADTTWTRTVTWPATVQGPVSLEPGQSPIVVTLSPGAYQSVSVNSGRTLRLQSGEYFFGSLNIGPQATMAINSAAGPVKVYLKGSFYFSGALTGAQTPGLPYASLTIYTTDTNTQFIAPNRSFLGILVAPNSNSVQVNVGTHLGAFFGRSVILFEGANLLHVRDPFSFQGFGPTDRATVTGGSVSLTGQVTDNFEQAETVTQLAAMAAVTSSPWYRTISRLPGPVPQEFKSLPIAAVSIGPFTMELR
jgi:hypothetical protein